MKKILSLILAVLLLIPAAAPAEDPDPIVGLWYVLGDKYIYPELMDGIGDYDTYLSVYYFNSDGTVSLLDSAVKDGKGTPEFTTAGKWFFKDNQYSYRIIGIGEGTMKYDQEKDLLKVYAEGTNMYMSVRRIVPFNPYKDYGID